MYVLLLVYQPIRSVEENGATPGSGTVFKMGGAKDAGKAGAPPDATDLHEAVAKQIKGVRY